MKALPTLTTIFAALCLVAGIAEGSVFLISESILMFLLGLPGLCFQIYEMTKTCKRKHDEGNNK